MRTQRATVRTVMAGLMLALGSAVAAQTPTLPAVDQQFMLKAAQGGMLEVKLGEMAGEKAGNSEVKSFGLRMVQDHGKANEELAGLAKEKGLALPAGLDPAHQKHVTMLARLAGKSFDKSYVEHMVKDHVKDVSEFQKQAATGKDPDVKAWASKTLPTLKDHLKSIKQIHAKMMAGKTPVTK